MSWFFVLVAIHILGATVWIGGHLILAVRVLPQAWRSGDPEPIRQFETIFEPVGLPALLIQGVTGLLLAHIYLPDPVLWLDWSQPLARDLGLKLLCLLLTLALAIHARLFLIPRLDGANLRGLGWHILAITTLGIAFASLGAAIRVGGV
jgi:putative copper export protein